MKYDLNSSSLEDVEDILQQTILTNPQNTSKEDIDKKGDKVENENTNQLKNNILSNNNNKNNMNNKTDNFLEILETKNTSNIFNNINKNPTSYISNINFSIQNSLNSFPYQNNFNLNNCPLYNNNHHFETLQNINNNFNFQEFMNERNLYDLNALNCNNITNSSTSGNLNINMSESYPYNNFLKNSILANNCNISGIMEYRNMYMFPYRLYDLPYVNPGIGLNSNISSGQSDIIFNNIYSQQNIEMENLKIQNEILKKEYLKLLLKHK